MSSGHTHTNTRNTTITAGQHSGIYFENKGSIKIINIQWTFLTYVNLTIYNEREKIVNTYLDSMKQYCVENKLILSKGNIICQHFKTVITDLINKILNKRANILTYF